MTPKIDGLLTRLSILFVAIPYLVFTTCWLNIPSAIGFSGVVLVSLFLVFKNIHSDASVDALFLNQKKSIYWMLGIIIIWIFFSGIGSYTFQNTDHLYRNAIFRDLVKTPWPVIYKVEGFEGHILDGKTTMMTYYLGYYLPAAALGKIFGFGFAKFSLFLWTVIGTVLVTYQIGKFLKTFSFKILLLFFGWGTLFFIGALYKYSFYEVINEQNYLWAGMRLYADSNLGLIYWTFNQSLPAWIIILLVFNQGSIKNMWLLSSFCFFLSPFAFVGLIPFLLYISVRDFKGSLASAADWQKNLKMHFSFQNVIGAGSVSILNLLYLSTNQAGKFFQLLPNANLKIWIVFILLSWGLIAVFILPKYKKEPLFWLIVGGLIPLPFFQQGYGIDFPGRVSIPALFLLMLLVGKYLREVKTGILRIAVLAYLAVSAIGHNVIETGRSMAMTGIENISHNTNFDDVLQASSTPTLQKMGDALEDIKDENICIKDFGTVLNPKNEVIWNYMADIEHSYFYKWFAKKPTQ